MYDYLVDHALKNVWCTPNQDLQAVVKPARLTPPAGVFNKVQVLWRQHALPVANARFHVYQIGQLHPSLMGLFPVSQVWTTMSSACRLENLIVNIYAASGVQMLRSEVWYMVTADKNLIIAVKEHARIPIDLKVEDIFIRVYTNAFFKSYRANAITDMVNIQGRTVKTVAEILTLQNQHSVEKTKPGVTYAFVNGFMVSTINLLTAQPGDAVEFVRDSSIYRVVEFLVGDLSTFESTIDNKLKYLLHYEDLTADMIDFHDDLDIYLVKPGLNNFYKGLYYHRNQEDAVRQVTHKDYSIPTPYVVGYAAGQSDWTDIEALKVRLHIRKSGYDRPLVNEDNRIKELYKLPDLDLKKAMIGLEAVVSNWTAESLEASLYVDLMEAMPNDVTGELVQDAYGYNAISKLLCDTPEFAREFSGQMIVDVPYGLQTRATGYEYDAEGLLLGWFTHIQGSVYATRNFLTRLVELIAGDGADRLDEVYGNQIVTLDPLSNYRMYRCPIVSGVANNVWEDVTDTGQYAITNGGTKLTWLLNPIEYYTLVRSDRTMLAYSLELPAVDGVLKFTFTHRQMRFNVISNWIMQIPLGELTVFLNGHSLIEGLDYFVQFPQVLIVNKEYLRNQGTTDQKVDIRFSGFCKADFTREIPKDVGFVHYGHLSHNNRFDIRDDKVMRIVVDGKLYDRSELEFSESDSAVSPLDARNGSPYLITDIVVPMRGFTIDNTYVMRERSKVIDQRISDYMTVKYPEPVPPGPSAIPNRYTLYSPFCNKIMTDLQNGFLDDPRLKLHYNDQDVAEICAPYLWLLDYDPTQINQEQDDRFVVIHPHNSVGVVALDMYHYKFITRVINLYLRGKVSLSHFAQISI